ncbi:MAG: hypothetical protein ACK4JD_09025 [Thermoflexales bacterium]
MNKIKKAITVGVITAMVVSMPLSASANMSTRATANSAFASGGTAVEDYETAAVPALAAAFAVGVVASFVANAAYDYAKSQKWLWAETSRYTIDERAEVAFDH